MRPPRPVTRGAIGKSKLANILPLALKPIPPHPASKVNSRQPAVNPGWWAGVLPYQSVPFIYCLDELMTGDDGYLHMIKRAETRGRQLASRLSNTSKTRGPL